MSEIGTVSDDTSYDAMFIVNQVSRKANSASAWISNDNGLGTEYKMVTSSGDRLVWSS